MTRFAPLLLIGLLASAGCAHGGAQAKAAQAPSAITIQPALLDRVHFASGSTMVLARDRAALSANARWALEHPDAVLVLEGHCDERGGEAFNLELGDRRARAVLAMLAGRGIDPAQLIVVSEGKRAPLDARHRPEAWARNRRVEFIVR
jgi:peptidoglycan-associated lipoprotein